MRRTPDYSRRNRRAGTAPVPPPGASKGRKTPEKQKPEEGIRINRYIAKAGVCSRRKADDLIAEGRVKVNGKLVAEPGVQVMEGDVVEVGGRIVSPRRFHYILLNKPDDTITTVSDERGRTTVLDIINLPEEEKAGLYPVGRLDRHTEGVLLLTNDGELAHRLMHPRYNVVKLYRVGTRMPVSPDQLDQMVKGIALEEGLAKADQVSIDPADPTQLAVQLHEGKNRQIRRMLEALGHEVVSLERISYAGLTTRGVRRGRWRRLEVHEIRRLRQLVHLK